jgi:hypothetical protein
MVDRARNDGYTVMTIPETVKEKIRGLTDSDGKPIRDLDIYAAEWNDSFTFTFIAERDLTPAERAVFAKTSAIFALIGGKPKIVKDVLISETMRMTTFSFHEAAGVWEPASRRIIIKRNQLATLQAYAGTLLHETAHARSGASDVSEAFEAALTELLGTLASKNV